MSQSKYDVLKLENQLCFPLYAASREVVKRYRPYLEALDLTYTQYIIMLVLWEHTEITVKELGERLYLDSGTLSPVLKSLETKGYVSRRRSASDERSVTAHVTEKGNALRDRAVDIPAQMAGCAEINREEAEMLYKLLYRILQEEPTNPN